MDFFQEIKNLRMPVLYIRKPEEQRALPSFFRFLFCYSLYLSGNLTDTLYLR